MSKVRKSKKARRPNIPAAHLGASPSSSVAGSPEIVNEPRAARSESAQAAFDYSYIRRDLARIGMLAGLFITIMVVLSFIIR